MKTLPLAILVLMFATVVVLIAGLVLMAIGGKVNEKHSNKLMVARVMLQGAAIIMLGIMFLLA